MGWASESEEEETVEEGEISRWDNYTVYESCGSSADDVQHVETLNVHRQQSHASADPHNASWNEGQSHPVLWYEDPNWGEDQVWSALLTTGEDQACLARFAEYWDDPNEEPIDHSLFADFDGDFSSEI